MKGDYIMETFKIIYTFEKGLEVTEEIEAESRSEVIGRIKDLEGFIEFTDKEETYHRFSFDDVKLVSIKQ
jgi:hypothetical protein